MKTLRHLVLAASAAVLAACATTTPYQAASKPGGFDGYSQTMLENDRARVTFGGNSLTDRETVENYLLYRAAEIAVERGFEYFTLAERETEAKKRAHVSARPGLYDPYFNYSFYRPRFGWSPFYRYSYFHRPYYRNRFSVFGSRYHDPFFNDYDVREITKYRASAEVKFSRSGASESVNTFNAREVLENLGPRIEYPEDKA